MKVFLHKDIEKIGMANEIVKVGDGFARNYLIPKKLATEITPKNEALFSAKITRIEHRKEVVSSKTSMLAERLSHLKITIKRKMHDDGKLYGSISQNELVDILAEQGISISKGQIIFDKSIKEKGAHKVTIKLTSTLKPQMTVTIVPEKDTHK